MGSDDRSFVWNVRRLTSTRYLSTRESEKVLRESQLFIKDNSGVDDPDVKSGMKTGLHRRSMYTNISTKSIIGQRSWSRFEIMAE